MTQIQYHRLLTEIIKRWNGYKSTSCSDHGGFRWAIFLPTIRRAQKCVHQRSRTVWKRYIENQGREAFQTSRIPGLYSYYTPMDKQYVISTIKKKNSERKKKPRGPLSLHYVFFLSFLLQSSLNQYETDRRKGYHIAFNGKMIYFSSFEKPLI